MLSFLKLICYQKAGLEKAEKDDLNELADSLGAALVLAPSKPTDVEIADENVNEDEVIIFDVFYSIFLFC